MFSKLIIFISLRVFNSGIKGIPLIVYEEPFTDENKLQPSDSNLYAPAALIGFSALT